jgi:hypothetical protein
MAIAREIIAAEQTRTAFRVELETEGVLVMLNYLIRVGVLNTATASILEAISKFVLSLFPIRDIESYDFHCPRSCSNVWFVGSSEPRASSKKLLSTDSKLNIKKIFIK